MFLNAIMLAGIGAVAVPILIHLLNKRKFQRVQWAAMRFLRVSIEQNQRRIRVEDILLLVLRCLILAVLALALARPVIRAAGASGWFGQAKVTAVIALDNSYSMSQTDGVKSRLDRAKDAAEQVVNTLPSGSAVAVLLASDVAAGLIPEPTYDLNLARQMLRGAPLSHRGTDLLPAVKKSIETLAGRPSLRKEVFVITDGQLAGWRQLGEIRRLLEEHKGDIRCYLILAGEEEERNLGISDLRFAGGLAGVDQPLRFEVQVTNYGRTEARDVKVSISLDGDLPVEEGVISSIAPGESRSIWFFPRLRSEGFHAVTARLAGDRLPADDSRTVAVRAVRELRVLLVDGDVGREPRESETFFLRHALQPVPPAERENFFVKVRTITAAEVEAARFDDYEVVGLCNVTDLSDTTVAALEQYLRRGGGLMFFPGDAANVSFYNEQLHQKRGILPAAMGRAVGDAASQERFAVLSAKAVDHPIVSIWSDPAAGSLASARFYKAFELVLGSRAAATRPAGDGEAGGVSVVARFADGVPAIVARDWGQGRVVQFASTADTAWNDLGARAGIFVPLVNRTVGWLIARQDATLNIRVGEKFVRRVEAELAGRDAIIQRPGDAGEKVRDSRRIEMIDGHPHVQYEQTDLGGAYEISYGIDAKPALKFAAQPDASESSLQSLSAEQLRQLGEVATVARWTGPGPLEEAIEKQRVGTELWPMLAWLALGLAATETLLAQWFSRSK